MITPSYPGQGPVTLKTMYMNTYVKIALVVIPAVIEVAKIFKKKG